MEKVDVCCSKAVKNLYVVYIEDVKFFKIHSAIMIVKDVLGRKHQWSILRYCHNIYVISHARRPDRYKMGLLIVKLEMSVDCQIMHLLVLISIFSECSVVVCKISSVLHCNCLGTAVCNTSLFKVGHLDSRRSQFLNSFLIYEPKCDFQPVIVLASNFCFIKQLSNMISSH